MGISVVVLPPLLTPPLFVLATVFSDREPAASAAPAGQPTGVSVP